MTLSLTHTFVSAKSDGADSTKVQPSNWNAEHTLTMATARLLGRTTAATGAPEEISVGTGLTFASQTLGLDATLVALAGVTTAADKVIYATASDTFSTADFTAYGRSIVAVANEAAFKTLVNLEIGVDVQAHSSVLDATTASFLTAQETKLGFISVTQSVDLDAIETRVNELDASVILMGTWDASLGSFPGGGTAQAGESWIVSVSGTVDSVAFVANDRIVAITDNASTTTYAANWHLLDYTDAVLSVDGSTGAVSLSSTYQPLDSDLTSIAALTTQAYGRGLLTYANETTFKQGVNLEIGVDVQAYASNLTSWAGLATSAKQDADPTLTALAGVVTVADKVIYATAADTFATADFTTYGRSIVAVANEAAFKTLVNLEIGVDVQAYNSNLTTWAGKTAPTGTVVGTSDTQTLSGKTIAFASNTLTNVMSLTTAQSVTAGTKKTFQANATNAGFRLAGVTANPSSLTAGDVWYRSDTEKLTYRGTSAARSLVAETLSATLTNKTFALGSNTLSGTQTQFNTACTDGTFLYTAAIGSTVQAYSSNLDSWSAIATSTKQAADATLTALAGVTTAADALIYATASDTFTTTTLSSFGRSLIDDADNTAARTTLGLGSLATLSSINNANWSGTQLAIANGGTGATSASTAFDALKQAATTTYTGVVEIGTTAEYLANTSGKALSTDQVWAAGAFTSLTDATTIAVDFSTGINFTVTLGANRTLGNPTNTKVGQSGVIRIVQDATGSRTLSYSANWEFAGGTAPTLTTTASATDYLYYHVYSSTSIQANLLADMK